MKTICKIIRMDFAICRKSFLLMIFSMLPVGVGSLLFFTPLIMGLFAVGATAIVSGIFAVESKSDMDLFYGCMPIQRWQYICGRTITCFLVILIPSVISFGLVKIGTAYELCRIEDIRLLLENSERIQIQILCAFIMLAFIGGANLLFASFVFKTEMREMLEVVFMLGEALVIGLIIWGVQKVVLAGEKIQFSDWMMDKIWHYPLQSSVVFLAIGIVFLVGGALLSVKFFRYDK